MDNQFGYGAAIGWALFILIVLFTHHQLAADRRRRDER